MYFNKQGEIIASEEWIALYQVPSYKRIANTELDDGKVISTMWIGLNHSFSDKSKPLIFETMVFSSSENWGDMDCNRYSTLDDAIKGHEAMVEKWKN